MQKGFAPILIVLLIAAAVGGYFAYLSLRANQAKPESVAIYPTPVSVSTPSPTPTESTSSAETANWKTYTGEGYSIKIPSTYITREVRANNQINTFFQESVEKDMPGFYISKESNQEMDPCTIKVEGFPDAKCIQLGSSRALDWSNSNDPYITHFAYIFIHNGAKYTLEFPDLKKVTKDQILSTFKFID